MKNPILPKKAPRIKMTQGNRSAGILDDFAVRKSVNTQEGTIEKTPVNDNDIVNKAYADSVGGGGVDWTISQAPSVIHADNYVDNDTTYVDADFDHNSLTNTHNLTTDIDHDSLTNTHNLTTDINHDTINGFVANEHIDWTADQGATNIHSGNYTDTDTTDHTAFSNIGTNTHAQIDTHIADGTKHFTEASIDLDNITEGSTNKFFTATDNTKLDGIEASADVTDAANVSSSGGLIYIDHGATAGTSRPAVSGYVMWIGSVEPTNATNGDTWIDTS